MKQVKQVKQVKQSSETIKEDFAVL